MRLPVGDGVFGGCGGAMVTFLTWSASAVVSVSSGNSKNLKRPRLFPSSLSRLASLLNRFVRRDQGLAWHVFGPKYGHQARYLVFWWTSPRGEGGAVDVMLTRDIRRDEPPAADNGSTPKSSSSMGCVVGVASAPSDEPLWQHTPTHSPGDDKGCDIKEPNTASD